jgi:hypothetical protein
MPKALAILTPHAFFVFYDDSSLHAKSTGQIQHFLVSFVLSIHMSLFMRTALATDPCSRAYSTAYTGDPLHGYNTGFSTPGLDLK